MGIQFIDFSMKKFLLACALTLTLSACGTPQDSYEVPEGKVLLEEFSDLQCPACKAAHPLVEKLQERFGDDLVVRFVHFPLEQIHPNAFHAAEAAECAQDQGDEEFWAFVTELYQNQDSLNDETFVEIGTELEFNTDDFSACIESDSKAGIVRADMKEGRSRQVNATPTFFLNKEKVENRKYEVMVLQIEELLNGGSDPMEE